MGRRSGKPGRGLDRLPDATAWTIDTSFVTAITARTTGNDLWVNARIRPSYGVTGLGASATSTLPEPVVGDPAVLHRSDLGLAVVVYARVQSGKLFRSVVDIGNVGLSVALTFGPWREVMPPSGVQLASDVDCATLSFASLDTERCAVVGSDGAVWVLKSTQARPDGAITPAWTSLGRP